MNSKIVTKQSPLRNTYAKARAVPVSTQGRRTILLLPAFVLCGCATGRPSGKDDATHAATTLASVNAPALAPLRVYAGCDSGAIYLYELTATTGALLQTDKVMASASVWLGAFAPDGKHLYTANLKAGSVDAFVREISTGRLTQERTLKVGALPAFVAADQGGRHLFVANHGSGTATVVGLDATGALGTPLSTAQAGSLVHAVQPDLSGRFVFAPNLAGDTVSQFVFDQTSGTLAANTPALVILPKGAGPRHIAFHPTRNFAYLINEKNNTVVTFAFDPKSGTLAALQTISTLPATVDPKVENFASDIHVHPSGRFVYGSNRGHDSIVIYAVDSLTGQLSLVGHQATGGAYPQIFAIAPAGDFLAVAHRKANNVATFRIDARTGTLMPAGHVAVDSAAHWVGFAPVATP